jgi:hypothetical protein
MAVSGRGIGYMAGRNVQTWTWYYLLVKEKAMVLIIKKPCEFTLGMSSVFKITTSSNIQNRDRIKFLAKKVICFCTTHSTDK